MWCDVVVLLSCSCYFVFVLFFVSCLLSFFYFFIFFFFFKQKTAYEMRISDWSSDVCSSDLPGNAAGLQLSDDLVGDRLIEVCPIAVGVRGGVGTCHRE